MHNLKAVMNSWGTTAKVFTVYSMSYSNDLTRHNHSAGNSSATVHWNGHLLAYAYELEAI